MEIEKAQKASALLKKINELSNCKKMFIESPKNTCFLMHNNGGRDSIDFNYQFTPMFMEVVDKILADLNNELSNL